MNRLDRLTAILIQLQSKQVVRAQEIAERFGISLRTVYRDVRSLETAGIPIIGEAGVGYSLVDGYRLPPVQFTAEEAAAFLTAEKLVAGSGVANAFKEGMLKIKAVLRLAEKDAIESLDQAVHVVNAQPVPNKEQPLPLILHSLAAKEVLALEYKGRKDEKPLKRRIEPIGVFFKNDAWYVVAWCQLRHDVRNFRLDQMQNVSKTGVFFEEHALSLQDYLDEATPPNTLLKATITAPVEVVPYIARNRNQQGFVSEKITGTLTEMHFQTPSYDYLARFAMQFADKVVALSPPELEQVFQSILKMAIADKI